MAVARRAATHRSARALPSLTLSAATESWSRHLRAEHKSPETITTYRKAPHGLDAWLASQGRPRTLDALDAATLEDYLVYLGDEATGRLDGGGAGLAPSTISQRFRSLQAFFRWAIAEGEMAESPLVRLKPPTIPDNPPNVLTDDELRALYATAGSQSFADRRDLALLRLFFSTGIRRGEMTGLRLVDLDLERGSVTVTGKFDRTRTVSFGAATARALDRYLRVRASHPQAGSPALWLGQRGAVTSYGIGRIVRRRAEAAGLAGVHAHLFRHSWAARALQLGQHEQDVSAQAGWRSPLMVSRYGRAVRDARALASFRERNPDDSI